MTTQYSENEQDFLKQFDSWELTEKQRQRIYQDFLMADEYALDASNGRSPLTFDKYEQLLESFERLVRKHHHITPKQATDIKTEGLIKGWADMFDKKEEEKPTFLSKVLSCLTTIKEKFL